MLADILAIRELAFNFQSPYIDPEMIQLIDLVFNTTHISGLLQMRKSRNCYKKQKMGKKAIKKIVRIYNQNRYLILQQQRNKCIRQKINIQKSLNHFFFSQAPLTVTHKTEKKHGLKWHAPAATIRHVLIILKVKRGIRASEVFNEMSDLAYHAIFFHVHPIG